ncbi:MAG: NapC/NirT family cytochrome c [Burkholderiales bacterium]|jgi:cytochrome c-type protein NapC|nr:NapC/NirT family cytochrome c [Burkholderiales bacterium]
MKKVVWLWLVIGIIVGSAALGVTEFALHATSTNEFCSSCHKNDAAPEWRASKHYVNAYGVRAGCSDCHIPKDFVPKMIRKTKALGEVYGHFTGVIDTPEKFEAKRLEMAESEWKRLKANGAQECRNCHFMDAVNNPDKEYLADMHKGVLESGEQVCTDCHKGVAHKAP